MAINKILQTCKNSALVVPLMAVAVMSGCHDRDMFYGMDMGDQISFRVSTEQSATGTTPKSTQASRSLYEKDTTNMRVITMLDKQGGTPLYLHVSTENNMETASMSEKPITRGAPVRDMNEYGEFGLFAYLYDGEWEGNIVPDYISNAKVTLLEDEGLWSTETPYFWPGLNRKIRFFAYAPYDCDGLRLPNNTQPQRFVYSVSEDPALQKDLLIAQTDEIVGEPGAGGQPLNFRHALTAVRFVAGDDMKPGTILSIELTNIKSEGSYTIQGEGYPNITSAYANKNFTLTLSKDINGADGEEITTKDQTLMMIPQTLPDDAYITIKYRYILDNEYQKDRIFQAHIGGQEWGMGETVTYRISLSSLSITPVLELTDKLVRDYQGKNIAGMPPFNIGIKSYVSVNGGGGGLMQLPAPWTARFFDSEDNEISCPDWLEFPKAGAGNSDYTTISLMVKPAEAHVDNHYEDDISHISINQTSGYNPYNLSNSIGDKAVKNTANCYIINAPGVYSLPLVYGNAVKNGEDNKSAYVSAASGNNVLGTFVNHLAEEIKSPYIYENTGCEPYDAVLVWQDVDGLISNVSLDGEKKYLCFEVSADGIKQSNAVVAVRDKNQTIMWSWHIWITGYKLSDYQIVTNSEGKEYKFMPVNVGEKRKVSKEYDGRSVKVRITQEQSGGLSAECLIIQLPYSEREAGEQPLFQFGRKDPIVDFSGLIHIYNNNGVNNIKSSIEIPNKRLNTQEGLVFDNLWNSNYSSSGNKQIIKTIYDPSPLGFCLPDENAFTGTTYGGISYTWFSHFSSTGMYRGCINSPFGSIAEYSSNNGTVFFCRKMEEQGAFDVDGGVIYFPQTGRCTYNSGTKSDLTSAYYWLADPMVDDSEKLKTFFSSDSWVKPNDCFVLNRGDACAVRPIKEE